MRVKDFELRKRFSEVSGVTALIDENITIKLNKYGEYEEIVKEGIEILNDKVLKVSPNFNDETNEYEISKMYFGTSEGIKYNEYIGFYHSLYVGHALEGNFRSLGSSGGIGTWLLKELLDKKYVDYVIHVKKTNNKNLLFKYDISKTISEVIEGAKTKYYPVELSETLKFVKKNPGRYALIGIPSFIMAVRLLSEVEPVFKERIKYMIGLVCGHQKSAKFSESMAWQIGIPPGNLENIDFRVKLNNNNASEYGVTFVGKDVNNNKVKMTKSINDLIGQNWGLGYFKLYASDFTDDVFNETADITIGDAWLNEYIKDDRGNNIVIVRNENIAKLIKNALKEERLKLDLANEELIIRSQTGHIRHTKDELSYRLYKLEKNNEWFPKKRIPPSNEIVKFRRKIQNLRKIISEKSHEVYCRAVIKKDFSIYKKEMEKMASKYDSLYRVERVKKIFKNLFIGR